MIRLAIYYTPPPETTLAVVARQWLGRDSTRLQCPDQKLPAQISPTRFREIIASPFHYGFHATLKPPFRLQSEVTIADIEDRLATFAAKRKSFILPQLKVSTMNEFVCLRPVDADEKLNEIAAEVVADFDDFRRPPSAEELSRRRAAGLSARQERLLTTWGYPYVMEEFRFHLTLTGRIKGQGERDILKEELSRRFTAEVLTNQPFSALSLFIEKDGEPLVQMQGFQLALASAS